MANLIFRKNGTNYTIDGLIAGTGHIIKNSSGQEVNARQYLQFNGVYVSDDAVGDKTEVNIVRQMTKAAMEALSSAEKEGFIDTTDEDDDYIPISAEDVKYGNTDVESKLDALTTDVSGKVSKSGDTMTGNLYIQRAGEALVNVKNTNTGCIAYLDSDANGDHGIWSNGYWNGSSFVSSGKWLIRRTTNGAVMVNEGLAFAPTTFTNTSFTPTVGGTKTLYTNSTGHSQIVFCSVVVEASSLAGMIYLYKNGNTTLAYSSWSSATSTPEKQVITLTAFAKLANGDTLGFSSLSGITFSGGCNVTLAY